MRTLDEIKTQIINKKTELLPVLNSSSQTAIWLIWVNIVATAIYLFEQILNKEKSDLESYATLQRYGTLAWWPYEVLKFQYGDQLLFNSNTGIHYYQAIDPTKQIIKRVAITEIGDSEIFIKVAKEDGGELVKLTATELQSFQTYVSEIKPAGTKTTTISTDADIIDSIADIYYDGTITEADIKASIEVALNEYKTNINYQNINGRILKNDLIDILRDIEGVNDVYFQTLKGKPAGGSYIDIEREYNTSAGYFNFETDMIDNWNYLPVTEPVNL